MPTNSIPLSDTEMLAAQDIRAARLASAVSRPGDLRRALDCVTGEHLRPIALGLMPLYVVYAVSHLFALPRGEAVPMAALAAATALVLGGLTVRLNRNPVGPGRSHLLGGLIAGLVLANSLAHLAITGNPIHTTNLMLLVVGVAVLLLHWQWMVGMLAATWAGWLGLAAIHTDGMPDDRWVHFAFGLLAATVLALIIHVTRVSTLSKLERLRQVDAQHAAVLAASASAIQRSEDRFRRLSQAAFEGLVFHDEGQIVDMNQSALEMFGYTLDEVRQCTVWDLSAPESHSTIRARIAFEDETPYETVALRKDGTRFFAEVHVKRLPYDGKLIHVVAMRDISDRKAIEQEREQLIQELDSFAHTVAHDLKGPLSLVVSYARMLIDEADALTERDRIAFINEIAQGSAKLDNIIDELLLLAQVRHGDTPLAPLDMNDILVDVCRRVVPLQQDTAAELLMGDEWPHVLGYGPWVEEVWYNYVCNAIKYGGDPPCVELGATPLPDGTVRFWVRDNGSGLNLEEQQQLFQPFHRLNRVNTKGYGLGLSIVQRIMDKLGGSVGVECEPGSGCTFYFTLQAASAPSTPVEA